MTLFGTSVADGRRAAGRNAILDVAMDLFLRAGIDNVTVDEVAAAVGVSTRTFYRYFSSKEEVFIAHQLRGAEYLPRAIAARPRAEPVLDAIFNAACEWDEAIDESFRVTTAIIMARPSGLRFTPAPVFEGFRTMVAAAIRARWPERHDAGLLAAVVVAVVAQVSEEAFAGSQDRLPLFRAAFNDLKEAFRSASSV